MSEDTKTGQMALTAFPPGCAPSFETLTLAQTELNMNAQAIPSTAGGEFGHAVLTMADAADLLLTGNVAYVVPVNPGDTPIHAAGATQPQIIETNRAHLVQKEAYKTYRNADAVLKAQLLSVCPDMYTNALKQPHFRYGSRTTLELLTHLWDSYGRIQPAQMKANAERMKKPWFPTEPIETLFSQLKDTFAFATAGDTGTTEIGVVRIGYEIISDTGLFKQELKEWRTRPNAEWTLIIFQTFFKAANIDRLATTTDGGFNSINKTTNATPATNDAAAAPLSELAALKLENARLKKLIPANATTTPPTTNNSGNRPNLTYCWTHGTSKNWRHTSKTCLAKGPGHQDDSTAENKMGGSTKIWTAPIAPKE